MGDGGGFVGGGGGVWARGGGVARRALFLGEATSAADELGEGSGSTFRASCSGVSGAASGAWPVTPSSACPATRNIWIQRVFCRRRRRSRRLAPADLGIWEQPPPWAVRRLRDGPHAGPGTRVRRAAAPYVSLRFRGLRARFMAKILRWTHTF